MPPPCSETRSVCCVSGKAGSLDDYAAERLVLIWRSEPITIDISDSGKNHSKKNSNPGVTQWQTIHSMDQQTIANVAIVRIGTRRTTTMRHHAEFAGATHQKAVLKNPKI
jgi:hypothetical protein